MEPNKGFSFRLDAPIDMRLDPRVGQSAAIFLRPHQGKALFVPFASTARSAGGAGS